MKVVYANEFYKRFNKLPAGIQETFRKQEKLFKNHWRDSRLQVKKLSNHPFPFSFRVTRAYRVLFVFIGPDEVLFATIGHRKDIYR